MTGEPRNPPVPPGAWCWAGAVLLAALVLAIFGGAIRGFRPVPSGTIPEDAPLPICLEPDGVLPVPPTLFRWDPSRSDIDASQVLLFDDRRDRFWQSAPVTGSELVIDADRVFEGAPAGRVYFWSVREVARGRPIATSAMKRFTFEQDVHGRGIGESLPGSRPFGQ